MEASKGTTGTEDYRWVLEEPEHPPTPRALTPSVACPSFRGRYSLNHYPLSLTPCYSVS